jgi:hypothetical protein
MATTKISALDATSTLTGGYFEIIIPDGLGGFLSKKILASTVLAGVTQPTTLKGLTTDATQVTPSNAFISKITLFSVAGTTPAIKVGTTAGGTEIMGLTTITDYHVLNLDQYWSGGGTLYFTISGGVCDIRIDLFSNYI